MRIAFIDNFLNIRGTSKAMFDYARYNETYLHNESIIISRPYHLFKDHIDTKKEVYDSFENRFRVYYYITIQDIQDIIDKYDIDIIYIIKGGLPNDNLHSFKNVKTIIHAVFDVNSPHGDIFCVISPWLNIKNNTLHIVLPHMISLPLIRGDLRSELKIPKNAIVFGRHGGYNEFDIIEIQKVVETISKENKNIYFLFLNTRPFSVQTNIIYLESTTCNIKKAKFINTCDAMIYGRSYGETFGLSIGEFSIKNKPIFAPINTIDKMHLLILKENAYWFTDQNDLYNKINNFKKNTHKWNMYEQFLPYPVMNIFNNLVLSLNIIPKIKSSDKKIKNIDHIYVIISEEFEQDRFKYMYNTLYSLFDKEYCTIYEPFYKERDDPSFIKNLHLIESEGAIYLYKTYEKLMNEILNDTTYENILILESDVLFPNNFISQLENCVEQWKTISNWDNYVLFLGNGCYGLISLLPCDLKLSTNLYNTNRSRCTDSMLWTRKSIKTCLPLLQDMDHAIDFKLNRIFQNPNIPLYSCWHEPFIFTQGSQNGTYNRSI